MSKKINKYLEMKNKNQKESDDFNFMFAFSNEQFKKGMQEKFGLTTEKDDLKKILSIGGGGYILKTDNTKLDEMFKRFDTDLKKGFADSEFVYDMFYYELGNHEWVISRDLTSTIDCLGLTFKEIKENPILLKGLEKAKTDVWNWFVNNDN